MPRLLQVSSTRALYKQSSWPFFHNRLDLSTKQFISKLSHCPSRSGLECVHCRFPVLTMRLVIKQRLRISAASSGLSLPLIAFKQATDGHHRELRHPTGIPKVSHLDFSAPSRSILFLNYRQKVFHSQKAFSLSLDTSVWHFLLLRSFLCT